MNEMPEAKPKNLTATYAAGQQPQPAQQEPVGKIGRDASGLVGHIFDDRKVKEGDKLYTSPPQRKPLTEREVELLDGLIEVQLDHALRCDSIGNRTMAEKQKAWDMERVELLRKLKAAHGMQKGGAEFCAESIRARGNQ